MTSWVEISRRKLEANVAAVRTAAGDAEVLAVIKADGYGHGAELVAPLLVDAGVRWLGVGDAGEGARVRQALGEREARLLVMSGFQPEEAEAIVEHGLTAVVWTPRHLVQLEDVAELAGARVRVHLEVDSGMARQGAAPGEDLAGFLEALDRVPRVRCEGVFSHLSSSEVHGSEVTERQLERFDSALTQLHEAAVIPEWVHLANSSALDEASTMEWLREREAEMGASVLVRPGLAIYGYCLPLEDGADEGALRPKLEPVLEWKTRVIGTREIGAGDTVGYGATFVADAPMRLALLPVGYADGFRREASSGVGDGWVMIAGERAHVVGRVSMNLVVVDVTEIDGVEDGTEVTLLGEGVTAEDHADWCGTIPYEILCGIRTAERRVV